jgi:hypothetical protein
MRNEDYYRMICDAWRVFKHYRRDPGDQDFKNDDYWEALVHDQQKFINRYPDSKFAVDIILAVICEIERISR